MPRISWSSDELGFIATGDLTPCSSFFLDSLSFLNFFQHNHVLNASGNILDLIFSQSNILSVQKALSSLVAPDSYHPALTIEFTCFNVAASENTHTYFDFKSGDYESISNFFNSFNWESTFSLYSINDAASVFNDALLNSINAYVPKKIFKNPKFPRWVSPALKSMIFEKKLAHATFKRSKLASDYSVFSEYRAKCKRLSKLDYRSYIADIEHSLFSNPSHFWKYTRELKQKSTIPSSVRLLNQVADNPLASANLFSKFFSSVFKRPFPASNYNLHNSVGSYDLPSNCFFSYNDVLSSLYSLKNNSSNGPDGISARLLYNCRHSIAYPIFILFRRSLDEGSVPLVWKTCSITPILKSGDPSDISNYRPISILPHLSKLFESIIYSSIKRSLNHIIDDNQYGFRPGKSSVSSSISFTTYILDNLEDGCQVDAIFTDIKKAFDTVDHGILLNVLESLGIGNPLLSWLRSYLTSRRQFVSINGTFSDLSSISSGVPQGSHLSPLLFILFVNTVNKYLSFTKIQLFADDIKIFHKINSLADYHLLQSDLDSFFNWTQRFNLSLNISKCFVMSFYRNRSPHSFSYSLNGVLLERVSIIKDLGIYLTPSLSFRHHINYTVNRALKVLGFIKRNTSHFSSVPCLRVLYFSLVRSILEYGVVVWHPYLAYDQIRIERVQNRFLSFIAFLLKLDHIPHDYSPIRSYLNIPTLHSRRIEADRSFITSLLDGSLDAPELLSLVSFRVPSHSSRHHTLFHIPSHRTSYGHNHPIHRMLRLLNND